MTSSSPHESEPCRPAFEAATTSASQNESSTHWYAARPATASARRGATGRNSVGSARMMAAPMDCSVPHGMPPPPSPNRHSPIENSMPEADQRERAHHDVLDGAPAAVAAEPAAHRAGEGEADGEDEGRRDEIDDRDPDVGRVLQPPGDRADVLEEVRDHHHEDREAPEPVDGRVAGSGGRGGRRARGGFGGVAHARHAIAATMQGQAAAGP